MPFQPVSEQPLTARHRERLHGRAQIIARTAGAVAQACAGDGALILLTGEPGIGKSRLAERLAEMAEARGATAVWGRCWEAGGAPAYWPWIQVFRGLRMDDDPFAVGGHDSLGGGAEQARFLAFDRAVRRLKARADEDLLTLVLDDLHCADTSSLLLLLLLARELRRSRILVVGTYRDAEARLAPEVSALLGKIAREAQVVALPRLALDEVREWLLDVSPAASAAQAADLHRLTEGHPLFVKEVLRLGGCGPAACPRSARWAAGGTRRGAVAAERGRAWRPGGGRRAGAGVLRRGDRGHRGSGPRRDPPGSSRSGRGEHRDGRRLSGPPSLLTSFAARPRLRRRHSVDARGTALEGGSGPARSRRAAAGRHLSPLRRAKRRPAGASRRGGARGGGRVARPVGVRGWRATGRASLEPGAGVARRAARAPRVRAPVDPRRGAHASRPAGRGKGTGGRRGGAGGARGRPRSAGPGGARLRHGNHHRVHRPDDDLVAPRGAGGARGRRLRQPCPGDGPALFGIDPPAERGRPARDRFAHARVHRDGAPAGRYPDPALRAPVRDRSGRLDDLRRRAPLDAAGDRDAGPCPRRPDGPRRRVRDVHHHAARAVPTHRGTGRAVGVRRTARRDLAAAPAMARPAGARDRARHLRRLR